MDYHQILQMLTTSAKENTGDFVERLNKVLSQVFVCLPEDLKNTITQECEDSNDISARRKYLQTILMVLQSLHNDVLSISETFMSVTEYRGVKIAIEMIISLGIIPCLLPGIGAGLNKLCPHAAQFEPEEISDLQKYSRLTVTTRVLTDCYSEISLRPAILTQLGPLLGAYFQLAYAPLAKPDKKAPEPQIPQELYEKLCADQQEFKERLNSLVKNSPLSSIMKELMVLSGLPHAPCFLKRSTCAYLTEALREPTGVMSLINAMCEDTIDIGAHWQRLEIASKLVAHSRADNCNEYFTSICNQILNILSSNNIQHSSTIANILIVALYKAHADICKEKIIDNLVACFSVRKLESLNCTNKNTILKSEIEISESLDNLIKCFVSHDAKFKHLPCMLIKETAVPLFYMHMKVYQSPLLMRSKVRELLLHLLADEKLGNSLLPLFLGHTDDNTGFSDKYSFEFGSSGGVQIINNPTKIDTQKYFEEIADSLYDLVKYDENLSLKLLNYLLNWCANSKNNESMSDKRLETTDDILDSLYKQLSAKKLLLNLVNTHSVRKGLMKSPQSLLTFIKSLFPNDFNAEEDDNIEILYASLMLIKVIITEGEKPNDWKPFNDLSNFLKEKIKSSTPSEALLNLIREVLDAIKTKGNAPCYKDLSTDKDSNFTRALRDLADPLIPVRAHGLISLTKLIESADTETLEQKDLVLCLIQENLKDDDSFVYLTAINAMCSLALKFPQRVIEILVQEFIDMPARNVNGEIAPENRAKLGEILVKTTRLLGDMAPTYKNILINGFLCAIRDSDELVRASSLSCLGELCKILGFRLGNAIIEIMYCVGCIIETDKAQECRRAAVLVTTLLIRGLGKDVLTDLGNDLLPVYRGLKYLRDNDNDQVLRLHAQLALEELDDIVQNIVFAKPILEKKIILLP